MARKWNARADTPSTIIMWVGSLLAVLISVIWLAKNLSTEHITLEQVDYEISTLQGVFSTACNMDYYKFRYNPRLNKGHLIIDNNSMCIDSHPCTPLYYRSDSEIRTKNESIFIENATICNVPSGCSAIYYTGEYRPVMDGSDILVKEAILCKDTSVSRCRILMCEMDLVEDIDLSKVTYVIVEKNDSFKITPME